MSRKDYKRVQNYLNSLRLGNLKQKQFCELLNHVKQMDSVEIYGRRWFQRTYGNTYCTFQVIIDGQLVHESPRQYGQGDYYVQAATEWLEINGYMPGRSRHEPFWRYCDDRGIKHSYHAEDVRRERDL